jgi:phosphoglycolate phosphatase
MKKYKHVIWDWNGTLLDDLDVCIESMNSVLRKRNLNLINRDSYMKVFNFPVKDYYIKLGFDFSKEPFETLSNDFTDQYENRCLTCKLQEQASEVLAKIHAEGITQSILTAAHQSYIEKCVTFYNIEKYFIRILGLDNTHAHGKVDNGKKLISELPYNANEVVLIGDTEHDYEVSKEIGCDCILVASGHHSMDRLIAKNTLVVESISEILEYILKQN